MKRELCQQVTGNPHWVLLPKVTLACHSTFRCPGVETGNKGEDSFALELSIFSQSGTGAARTKGHCLCGWSQIPNKSARKSTHPNQHPDTQFQSENGLL